MATVAILGTGNIAQTLALDLKLEGHTVRLFAPEYLAYRIRNLMDYAMGHGCHALTSIEGPNSITDRYLTEDVPFNLVCWASLGKLVGVATPMTDAVITLIGVVHGKDWFAQGRTAQALGLTGRSADAVIRYARTGAF